MGLCGTLGCCISVCCEVDLGGGGGALGCLLFGGCFGTNDVDMAECFYSKEVLKRKRNLHTRSFGVIIYIYNYKIMRANSAQRKDSKEVTAHLINSYENTP